MVMGPTQLSTHKLGFVGCYERFFQVLLVPEQRKGGERRNGTGKRGQESLDVSCRRTGQIVSVICKRLESCEQLYSTNLIHRPEAFWGTLAAQPVPYYGQRFIDLLCGRDQSQTPI